MWELNSFLGILGIVDTIVFVLFFLSVIYLFIFALGSLKGNYRIPQESPKNHRIAVLFPAYKEDRVIESVVHSFLMQDYPKDKYDVVVISDHMHEMTNESLSELPIKLLIARYENSSKAKALNFAIDSFGDGKYDIVVILDADNTVAPNFLQEINNAYYNGAMAMQAHRVAKNRDTDVAILDGMSEEINNSIFRKGHVRFGMSCALIGSGMAFDYKWFKENVKKLTSAGEDRELEVLLLSQRVYVEYLEDVEVYDEKIQKSSSFYNQRRRWLAAQFGTLATSIRDLPGAILTGNLDYADKLLQWMLLPRVVLIGLLTIISLVMSLINWKWSVKWWVLLFIILLTMSIALPDKIMDHRLRRTLKRIPFIFLLMIANMFRLKGVNKKFIHTEHGEAN